MYEKVLSKQTKQTLESLRKIPSQHNLYLAGGTALALQLNHRKSIDLDFFSESELNIFSLKNTLIKNDIKFKLNFEDNNTLDATINSTKTSFFYYPYPLLFPKKRFQNIFLADWRDIACMKISAISSRGSKKDFIDLFFILKKISLSKLLKLFDRKYRKVNYNKLHILKSLVFFEDAEKEPMPKMIKKVDWREVKKEITERVKRVL